MRLDKFLKVSRIIKRRTVAAEACGSEYVRVNGKTAKASYAVKVGDIITVKYGGSSTSFRVKELDEKATKEKSSLLYEVVGNP
ncbi:MAG: RNA-binding S4 domain-containing protein [Eubacteriales bacterium]